MQRNSFFASVAAKKVLIDRTIGARLMLGGESGVKQGTGVDLNLQIVGLYRGST